MVGEADDGVEAVELVRRAASRRRRHGHPHARASTGSRATRRIVADPDLADVRVVVLTTFDLDEYVFEAVRAGATGFLLKDSEPTELLRAVRVRRVG